MIGFGDKGVALSPADGAGGSAASTHTREGVLHSKTALDLHHGGQLPEVHIAWRLTGEPGAPLVVALGGISAGRYVWNEGSLKDTCKGWWNGVVGPGAPLDTDRCQVLGFDYLGGSGQTTGPCRGQDDFPAISAYDQAEILRRLLDHLGIDSVRAIAGASYGGMVALAFAERRSERVGRIVVISAADRAHPMSTAWRSMQRAIVRFAAKQGEGPEGLRLARALAMATYRSADEFASRFSGPPVQHEARFRFPVESYLLARGDAYAHSYVPEAFVCLSESIDLHRVDASAIRVPATLVAVREDQLVPRADMQSLGERLAGPVDFVELSSLYGHDAFLKEGAALRPVFARLLEEESS